MSLLSSLDKKILFMPIDNLEEMIVRQLSNNLTEQEAKELLNWYNTSEDNRKLYRDYCVLLKAQSVASDRRLFEKDKRLLAACPEICFGGCRCSVDWGRTPYVFLYYGYRHRWRYAGHSAGRF